MSHKHVALMASIAAISASACSPFASERSEGARDRIDARRPGQDWATVIEATPDGGFRMGNPNARVALVEYGSLTCHFCANFEREGAPRLVEKYVRSGQVSWEFRNFVRDPADLTASLLARCGQARSFFALTRALYSDQENWTARLQSADPDKLQSLQSMAPVDQLTAIGEISGLKTFVVQRGLAHAEASRCLANEAAINQLIQLNSDAVARHNIRGTPAFVINGQLVEQATTWESLEPEIKSALQPN